MSYIVVVEIYIHNYDNNGLLHSYTHTLGSRADHVELRKKGCESLTTTPGRFGSIIFVSYMYRRVGVGGCSSQQRVTVITDVVLS